MSIRTETPTSLFLLVAALIASACDQAVSTSGPSPPAARASQRSVEMARRFGVAPVDPGGLSLDTGFSKLELRDFGSRRSLFFVHDDGALVLQTRIDLANPHVLQQPYTQTLFASYLFQPEPSRALLVGLGGGAMVRFLEHHDGDLLLDAIDIDPEIVAIADRYFGTRSSERVRVMVADGYEFIRGSQDEYDVIYMDAFLRPSDETDRSGSPLRLKESSFYGVVIERLTAQGVAAFNLSPHPRREEDVEDLRRAFPQVYVFDVAGELNWVAIATQEATRRSAEELRAAAVASSERFGGELPFLEMLEGLQDQR